jgi:hypothetical protein
VECTCRRRLSGSSRARRPRLPVSWCGVWPCLQSGLFFSHADIGDEGHFSPEPNMRGPAQNWNWPNQARKRSWHSPNNLVLGNSQPLEQNFRRSSLPGVKPAAFLGTPGSRHRWSAADGEEWHAETSYWWGCRPRSLQKTRFVYVRDSAAHWRLKMKAFVFLGEPIENEWHLRVGG